MTALLVAGILVLLIVVHEFGHFIVAKICKVRVEEFGIGYPPRAFTFGRWGRTEYTLNWLPFGGFVRLYGDDGNFDHGKGSLIDAPRYAQALILVAGVTANALLAWVLFAASLMIGVPTLVDSPQPGEKTHLYVSQIVSNSPMVGSGVEQGDEILMVTDSLGQTLEPLTPATMTDYVKVRGGKDITITYRHADSIRTATVQPANAVIPGAEGRPALGVGLALVANRTVSPLSAFAEAAVTTKDAFVSTAVSLWQILAGSFTGNANLTDIVGPVGLVSVVHMASENGFGNVVKLAAFISVNLAIINLFPIPALDGGRLVILGIEAIRNKRISKYYVQILNGVSILLVVALMIVVTYNDIGRLLG